MAVAKTEVVHENIEEHSKMFRDLLLGFVKTHVLHHASREPIYGVGMISELERHGYRLSPGTLYPLLHNLEAVKFLERDDQIVDGKVRKYYRITPLGRRALDEARRKILELVAEITDDPDKGATKASAKAARSPRSRPAPAKKASAARR
jgi:DNA-binding PadR family transcriptional regulator